MTGTPFVLKTQDDFPEKFAAALYLSTATGSGPLRLPFLLTANPSPLRQCIVAMFILQ